MIGQVWQTMNTMFKNPKLEQITSNYLKTSADINKLYRNYMLELPLTHIHGQVQKKLMLKLSETMCLIAKQLRHEKIPSIYLRISPMIFYLGQMSILDKKILFPSFSEDNLIVRDETEMKELLETYYAEWNYVDAKMVQVKEIIVAMLMPPNFVRLYITYACWGNPSIRYD